MKKAERIKSRRGSPSREVSELLAKRLRRETEQQPRNGKPPTMPSSNGVRYEVLGQLCAQRRAQEGLTLRDIEREIGVSASSLSRLENGRIVNAEHVAALVRWLGLTTEQIFGATIVDDLPQQVSALILADPKLDSEQREALCMMFSTLYRHMARMV